MEDRKGEGDAEPGEPVAEVAITDWVPHELRWVVVHGLFQLLKQLHLMPRYGMDFGEVKKMQ